MNPVSKAIAECRFNIPYEILDITFKDSLPSRRLFDTIDNQIRKRVVDARVLVDTNLVGGAEAYVPVGACRLIEKGNGYTVIEVPDSIVGKRNIIDALSIITEMGTQTEAFGGNSALEGMVQMGMTASRSNVENTAALEVIGDNVILVYDSYHNLVNTVMKVLIENKSNMTNLKAATYPAFASLVVMAVKAYIYNHMIIKLGAGYIYEGHELGVIKEKIEEYAEANAEYNEYLTIRWKKIALMDDAVSMRNYVSSLFPPML